MEGYLEIFGRKFCGKKGNFGLWRRKLFFGSGNTAHAPRGNPLRLTRSAWINKVLLLHINGYDKLKPFGFCIHTIDGYTHRILWLEVGPSNNNPVIIAQLWNLHTI